MGLNWKYWMSITALFMVLSCKNTNSDLASDTSARLQYSAEENEVEVVELSSSPFMYQLVSNGKLHARSYSKLSFRSSGNVTAVNFKNGDRVRKGTVIASLDPTSETLALESSLISLQKAELDLYDVLAGQGYSVDDTLSVPEDVLAMAKMRSGYNAAKNLVAKSRLDLEGCFIRAPFSGKVADLNLKANDLPGSEPVCTVLDDAYMEVEFTVLESEYPVLAKGLNVKVYPYADKALVAEGVIKTINPSVDEKGQIKVTASVQNKGRLLDGMNVKVIVEKLISDQLVVPKSAVVLRDNLEVVFLYDGGKAKWTYVNILMSNSDSHSIKANESRNAVLKEGDQVIVSGNLNLADGSEIKLK